MTALTMLLHPDLVIASVSDAYAQAVLVVPDALQGQHLFSAFPDNPSDPDATGTANLGHSIETVLRSGLPDRMALQRYDVRDYITGAGDWVEKFWLPENTPVFGSGSEEITHVLHTATDVTVGVQLERWLHERAIYVTEQRATLELMQAELAREDEVIRASQARVSELMNAHRVHEQLVELQLELGAPETRRYFGAGDRAPRGGIYRIYHARGCEDHQTRVLMREWTSFPPCHQCRRRVVYRFHLPVLP